MKQKIYESVESYEKERKVSVNSVLPKLGVSSSGYYSWKNWEKSRQEIKRERVKREIKNIYERSKKVYGAPKIRKNWRKSEPEDGKQIYEGYEFKSNMGKEI